MFKHFAIHMFVFLLAACAANPPDTPLPEGDGPGVRGTAAPSPTTTPATLTPAPVPSETPTSTPTETATPTATATEAPKLPETITFELTDGTTLEMRQFQDVKDALEYIEKNTYWWTGGDNINTRNSVSRSWDKKTKENLAYYKKLDKIPGGAQVILGVQRAFPKKGDLFFIISSATFNSTGKVCLSYRNIVEDRTEVVFVDVEEAEFIKELSDFQFATPTPQP